MSCHIHDPYSTEQKHLLNFLFSTLSFAHEGLEPVDGEMFKYLQNGKIARVHTNHRIPSHHI